MYKIFFFICFLTVFLSVNNHNEWLDSSLELEKRQGVWKAKTVELEFPLEGRKIIKYKRKQNIFFGKKYLVDVDVEDMDNKVFKDFLVEKEYLESLYHKTKVEK